MQDDTLYIIIKKENNKYPQYRIENKSKYIWMKYRQTGAPYAEEVLEGESKLFAFDSQLNCGSLQCQFYTELAPGSLIADSVNMDQIGKSWVLDTSQERGFTGKIYWYVHTNGYTKILTISDKNNVRLDQESENHTPTSVNINLNGLGISIITTEPVQQRIWDADEELKSNEGQMSRIWNELCYVNLTNIAFVLIEFETSRWMQLMISKIQLDNQTEYQTPFPVTIVSELNWNPEGKELPFFNLSIS